LTTVIGFFHLEKITEEDTEGPPMLYCEFQKALKELKNKKNARSWWHTSQNIKGMGDKGKMELSDM